MLFKVVMHFATSKQLSVQKLIGSLSNDDGDAADNAGEK